MERPGIPLGRSIDGTNHNDVRLLEPTVDATPEQGWIGEIDTKHLDRCHDYPEIRRQLNAAGLDDHVTQRRHQRGDNRPKTIMLGPRWIAEGTNSWMSNYGQLRCNTDRKNCHRHAALCLVTTFLLPRSRQARHVARPLEPPINRPTRSSHNTVMTFGSGW